MTESFYIEGGVNKNSFFGLMNAKYSQINIKQAAQNLFKKSADIGTAVVNIIGSTGIAGFQFHIPKTEQVKMESDITDYYVEDNSAVQDHIARKPVTVTLQGLQGEYFYSVNEIKDLIALVTPTMSLIKQFTPKFLKITEQFKRQRVISSNGDFVLNPETGAFENKITSSYEWNFNGVDLFKLFQDFYKLKSAQTRAFYFFQALWESNALFSIETSWRRYDDMAITSVVPFRDNNADITDFTVTFKQIKKVSSYTIGLEDVAGRLKQQKAEIIEKGVDKGMEVDTINVSANQS